MSAHTPGPWVLWTSCSWRRVRSAEGNVVCEPIVAMDGHPDLSFGNWPASDANARLITAAPDLLAALKDAQEWVCADYCDDRHTQRCFDMRDAIAKAEGK